MEVEEKGEPIDLELAKYILPKKATEKAISTIISLSKAMRKGSLCVMTDCSHEIPSFLITENPSLDALPETPLCQIEGRLYFQRFWVCEAILKKHFERLVSHQSSDFDFSRIKSIVEKAPLRAMQKEAVLKAALKKVLLLCGGPGTGKTYTAGNLLEILLKSSDKKWEVALVAPTGKAAMQLQKSMQNCLKNESVFFQATTIHSFLKVGKKRRPNFLEPEKVSADIVLVDETSMVDVELLALLFASLKDGARLILLGDPNQLPPVEAGSLFRDLVEREKSRNGAIVELNEALRQESGELITFGEAVKEGESRRVVELLKRGEGVEWLECKEDELFRYILTRMQKEPDRDTSPQVLLTHFQSFALLTPFRRGRMGVTELNKKILPYYTHIYPILVTRNDKELELFNGDLGVLVRQSSEELTPEDRVYFYDQESGYKEMPALVIPSFEPAFALSVHKSQGSEYQEVLILLPEGAETFGREVFYTAVTRAKQRITVWGEKETICKCVSQSERRLSGLY